jgi:hypothetical protein
MTEDQSGNTTTYSYGDPLYPTQMVLPGGATSTVTYNLDGQAATSVTIQDPLGARVRAGGAGELPIREMTGVLVDLVSWLVPGMMSEG